MIKVMCHDKIYLGLDTSCYTTSFAAVNEMGMLVAEKRRLLAVAVGKKGLRQSEALFQHIKEGQALFAAGIAEVLALGLSVAGVGVSTRPRSLMASYMPVFLAGRNNAALLAAAFGVPLIETSHQEGHLMAGLAAAQLPPLSQFLGVQLSGGTTEILAVTKKTAGFETQLLGGSLDLHVGQLVDRIGVALGLGFPCGPGLDKLAMEYPGDGFLLKAFVREGSFALSGGEAQGLGALAAGVAPGAVAKGVFQLIAKSLAKSLQQAVALTGLDSVLVVGGVCGSECLKQALIPALEGVCKLYVAPPYYGKDNAFGVALLAKEACCSL